MARENLTAYAWSTDALQKARAYIRDESNTTGLVVVDRGRVVFKYGDIEELSYIASVRKSILSMLYGYWVENGTIKLDTTLEALKLDDIGGLLPIEKQATIENVITARSGVYHPASYSGDDLAKAPPRGSQKPGTYMLYSNWDFNIAGAIFEQLTGRSIYDELQAQLAIPLQFEDWNRQAQHKEGDLTVSKYPAYPIWISTRDMARIGYLMLNEGAWNGTQIISRDWARRIVSVVTPVGTDEPACSPRRLLRLRLHVVGVGRPPRGRGIQGRLHRRGCRRPVDHRASVAEPRRRAQDQQHLRAVDEVGVMGAHPRTRARGEGREAGGPVSLGEDVAAVAATQCTRWRSQRVTAHHALLTLEVSSLDMTRAFRSPDWAMHARWRGDRARS